MAGGYASNGGGNDFALARYTITGTLDIAFDTDGIVTTTIGTFSLINDLAMQTDGKIVVGGSAYYGTAYRFALARYNSNGALDTTFDTDGLVTSTFGSECLAYAIAIQTDGKILAAGNATYGGVPGFALARYESNGALDATFGAGGVVTATLGANSGINGVSLQPDGKIVVAGFASDGTDIHFALARYDTNGALDITFDTDGLITTTVGTDTIIEDRALALALQPDGKILAGGYTFDGVSDYYGALVRYTTTGALDSAFGAGGVVTLTRPAYTDIETFGIGLQTNGKIVVAGYAWDSRNNIMVARYNGNGTLDTTFGGGDGIIIEPLGTDCFSYDIKIQPNGYIVIGGSANYGGVNYFTLMRFK